MATITLHSEFSTWEDFFSALKQHIDETYQPMVKTNSRTVVAANARIKDGNPKYPEEMKYVYYKFECTHRGLFKSKSTGIKKTKSSKEKCGAKIYACLDHETRTKIIVKQLNENHNHEIGPHLYRLYAQNRTLDHEEKAKVNELRRLNVPAKSITQEIRAKTGKNVVNQDIWNANKQLKKKEKLELNDSRIPTLDPDLQNSVTPFAFDIVSMEATKSAGFSVHVFDGCTYVTKDQESYEVSDNKCGCVIFRNHAIPCRHIIAARKANGQPELEICMFAKKWLTVNDYASYGDEETSQMPEDVGIDDADRPNETHQKMERYWTAKPLLDKILHELVEITGSRFDYYIHQLQQFEVHLSHLDRFAILPYEVGTGVTEEGSCPENDGEMVMSVNGDDVEILCSEQKSRQEDQDVEDVNTNR